MTSNSFTKTLKSHIAFCLIAISFTLNSCGSMVKSMTVANATVEKKAIPPDFGKGNSTLICVISGQKSYDNYMKKLVKKEYHGKYEFVLKENLYSEKYKNHDTYRYVFDRNVSVNSNYVFNPQTNRGENRKTTSSAFFITDRKKGTTYKCPMTSSFFAGIIHGYVINLEKERVKSK